MSEIFSKGLQHYHEWVPDVSLDRQPGSRVWLGCDIIERSDDGELRVLTPLEIILRRSERVIRKYGQSGRNLPDLDLRCADQCAS